MSAMLALHAELSLIVVLVVVFLADLFRSRPGGRGLRVLVCALMLVQVFLSLSSGTCEIFGGMYVDTPFTSMVKSVLSAGTLLVFLQSGEWAGRPDTAVREGEFYVITLSTLLGMFFMLSAGHFLIFYVGLEMASIPMACLVAMDKWRRQSAEAGAKFILSSMFSSALLLYGLSLFYGTTGTLYFADLPGVLRDGGLERLALVLFVAGMGFKMSLVPFHLWTADVYQGAPTGVTAYLSVISKGAAAVALAVVVRFVFPAMTADWSAVLALLSVVTITVGNLMAVLQHDMKRFMAFSSISQAGYIVLGVLAGSPAGMASLAFYVAVYVVANVAVFAVISTVEQHGGGRTGREAFCGLYATNPRLALVMTLALFSLGGIPPFAGFFSKFFIFAAAFEAGWHLVVFLALLNTVISLYYYLLVVKAMYISAPAEGSAPAGTFRSSQGVRLCLALCTLGVCVLGVLSCFYGNIFHLAGMLPW